MSHPTLFSSLGGALPRAARMVVLLVALALTAAVLPATGAGAAAARDHRRDSASCYLGYRLVPQCGGRVLAGA